VAEAFVGRQSAECFSADSRRRGQSGYREILAMREGVKEDKASWTNFLRDLKAYNFLVSDKCLGLVENFAQFYSDTRRGRSVGHETITIDEPAGRNRRYFMNGFAVSL